MDVNNTLLPIFVYIFDKTYISDNDFILIKFFLANIHHLLNLHFWDYM